MQLLAQHTEGKSGSDLKELCRRAVILAAREARREGNGDIFQNV